MGICSIDRSWRTPKTAEISRGGMKKAVQSLQTGSEFTERYPHGNTVCVLLMPASRASLSLNLAHRWHRSHCLLEKDVIFYARCFWFSEVTNVSLFIITVWLLYFSQVLIENCLTKTESPGLCIPVLICEAILCNPFREMTKALSPTSSAWRSLPCFCLPKCHRVGGQEFHSSLRLLVVLWVTYRQPHELLVHSMAVATFNWHKSQTSRRALWQQW